MKRAALLSILSITLWAHIALCQEDFATASIADVRQFIEFELAGGRVTDAGWRAANKRFFLDTRGFSPAPPPQRRNVLVVSDKFFIKLRSLQPAGNATVEASFPMCYGRIDSELRFVYRDTGVPKGVVVLASCSTSYDMVAGRIAQSHIGSEPGMIMLTRITAIEYVAEKLRKTKDPEIRLNAKTTLVALKKLRPY